MNEQLFNFFYSFAHQNPILDDVISFVATWYGLVILTLLFLYLFEHRDNPKKGFRDLFVVGIVAISAWFIAHFLKEVFHTLRPFEVLPSVTPLFIEDSYAFPSGHAAMFMALATSLWFYHKKLSIFFAISAVFIGIARVMAGVHWPVDILGGLALGYILGVGIISSTKKWVINMRCNLRH
ncbi:MAG: phosphatase PAP2 family protein [Patescibacteria group bacterium]